MTDVRNLCILDFGLSFSDYYKLSYLDFIKFFIYHQKQKKLEQSYQLYNTRLMCFYSILPYQKDPLSFSPSKLFPIQEFDYDGIDENLIENLELEYKEAIIKYQEELKEQKTDGQN